MPSNYAINHSRACVHGRKQRRNFNCKVGAHNAATLRFIIRKLLELSLITVTATSAVSEVSAARAWVEILAAAPILRCVKKLNAKNPRVIIIFIRECASVGSSIFEFASQLPVFSWKACEKNRKNMCLLKNRHIKYAGHSDLWKGKARAPNGYGGSQCGGHTLSRVSHLIRNECNVWLAIKRNLDDAGLLFLSHTLFSLDEIPALTSHTHKHTLTYPGSLKIAC